MTFTLLLVLLPLVGLAGPYRLEEGFTDKLKQSFNSLIQGGNVFELMEKGDAVNLEKLLKSHPKLAMERNFYKMTPLHLAPNKQIAKLLLDYGAEINAKTYYFHPELFQMLIDHGADPSLLDKESRVVEECVLTDVYFALKHHPDEKARILKILTENRAKSSAKGK